MPKRSAEQIVLDASVDFESFYAQRSGSVSEPAPQDIHPLDYQ